MNHRQWKKKFKKQHGRNPYWFEDKKRVMNTQQSRAFCRALGSTISIIQNQFVPTISKALAEFNQACVEAGRAAALALLRLPETIEKTDEEDQEEKDGVQKK